MIEVAGKKQIISPASDMVGAYDPATGAEIWKVRYSGYSVIPRPIFGHGMIFISTGYNDASVLAIKVDGKGDVTDTHVLWKKKKGLPYIGSALVYRGQYFMVKDGGLVLIPAERSRRKRFTQTELLEGVTPALARALREKTRAALEGRPVGREIA